MQLRLRPALVSLLAVCILVGVVRPLGATPGQKLAEARRAFELGEYETAVPLLSYLLYPTAQLSSRDDLMEAHLLLGLAHLELGNQGDAKREIEEALFLDSKLSLDPLVFSARAIEFVEERRREVEERAERDAKARVEADARERLRELLENTIVIERRPFFINFIPFGAGQFQNGHRNKGIAFAVSEAALCGLSVGVFGYLFNEYGFNGVVPSADADRARQLQGVQAVSGGLCLAVMTYGVVDSLVYYESTTRVPANESLLPDELKEPRQQSRNQRPRRPQRQRRPVARRPSSVGLRPIVRPVAGPRSGGVIMTWEF